MNSLFLIEAEVSIRVRGISGPFQQTVGWLVNARNITEARSKFNEQVKQDFSHMRGESFEFKYLKQLGEIK